LDNLTANLLVLVIGLYSWLTILLVTIAHHTLYAIDQHAAHERVLFEKLQTQIYGSDGQEVNIQPHHVKLSMMVNQKQATWLDEYQDLIKRYKWDYYIKRCYTNR